MLITTIDDVLKLVNPVLTERKNKDIEFPIAFTFHHLLERIKVSLDSLHLLVKDNMHRHDHAVGLIARSLLTDFITVSYVIKFSPSKEDAHEKLYALYNDDLKRADGFLKIFSEADPDNAKSYAAYDERYRNDTIYKIIRDYALEFNRKHFPQRPRS